ncbi:hypothetical protein BZA05DRAFT_445543 [Tricharina praecox]|uniref:uncharacterized protein n=1 Tax=Tricharina praecox TaxID=43433 RepID=UPI00221F55A4|nr:uncharacterized protein BZA05DRAFT_445543 [Tricharina praecox]KAI5850711.1 hypothetical protein BZA05DRAFT_445543 [Tricharina praecox]
MHTFIPPQPPPLVPQHPAPLDVSTSSPLPAAPQPQYQPIFLETTHDTGIEVDPDINNDIGIEIDTGISFDTIKRSRQVPNLDDYRPPRRNSPQYELVSHFSAIQVDDEIDPEADVYAPPAIPDVLAMRRGRWGTNVAMVYRTARQRRNDNLPKHSHLAGHEGVEDDEEEEELVVDDDMDVDPTADEASLQLCLLERATTDRVRICKKKQMRKRKRNQRGKEGGEKEGGGKRRRERDKKAIMATADRGDGSGGGVPVAAAPILSDGQHAHQHH